MTPFGWVVVVYYFITYNRVFIGTILRTTWRLSLQDENDYKTVKMVPKRRNTLTYQQYNKVMLHWRAFSWITELLYSKMDGADNLRYSKFLSLTQYFYQWGQDYAYEPSVRLGCSDTTQCHCHGNTTAVYIPEMPSSNICRDTEDIDWGFCQTSTAAPVRFSHDILNWNSIEAVCDMNRWAIKLNT
jgi:hypothetical protein